jgi:hypothetical protein
MNTNTFLREEFAYVILHSDFMFIFDFIIRDKANRLVIPEHYERVNYSLNELYELTEISENYMAYIDDLEDFDPVYRHRDKREILYRIEKANDINKHMSNKEFNKLFERSKDNMKQIL